jgi:CRP-like cAMP-binding protein
MEKEGLGKLYHDREVIVRQGEPGDCMYVVQDGRVEVVVEAEGGEERLAVLGPGDVFGEMALFERELRCATVRAIGEPRVLTVDRKGFLRRVHEDPSLAYRILQMMSRRLREANARLGRESGTGHPAPPTQGRFGGAQRNDA